MPPLMRPILVHKWLQTMSVTTQPAVPTNHIMMPRAVHSALEALLSCPATPALVPLHRHSTQPPQHRLNPLMQSNNPAAPGLPSEGIGSTGRTKRRSPASVSLILYIKMHKCPGPVYVHALSSETMCVLHAGDMPTRAETDLALSY
jgi:hypothetical protein